MGKQMMLGRRILDQMIADHGEVDFINIVCSRIASGDSPQNLCHSFEIPWMTLRQWLEYNPERMEAFDLAKRCFADKLAWDAINAVIEADVDTVQLAGLRSKTFIQMAEKYDRKQYGNKMEVEVTQTISILGALEEAKGRVIDGEVNRLKELSNEKENQ